MSWLPEDFKVSDIKSFVPKEYLDKYDKKRGGIIPYTEDGYLFLVFQNVYKWSFPKGHFERDEDSGLLDTAIREFRQESGYKKHINEMSLLDKKMVIGNHHLYLLKVKMEDISLEITPESESEIIGKAWIHIKEFDSFRERYPVNATISKFNIETFKKLSGL